MKKLMVTALWMALGLILSTNAQQVDKSNTVSFEPNWYVGVNGGVSWFLAEGSNILWGPTETHFTLADNGGPFGRLSVGYNFTPVVGVRGFLGYHQNRWADNRFAGNPVQSFGSENLTGDLMINLSNWISGYRPERFLNVSMFGGLGGAFLNNNTVTSPLSMIVRGGLQGDFRLSPQWALNLIAESNINGDNFNDYVTGFPLDLAPALSLGLTYTFGETKKAVTPPDVEPQLEPIAEVKPVEPEVKPIEPEVKPIEPEVKPIEPEVKPIEPEVKPIEPEKPLVAETKPTTEPEVKETPIAVEQVVPSVKESIFYSINKTAVEKTNQKDAVERIVEYLNKYPQAKVVVSGYADKATGTAGVNQEVSKQRAMNVANTLINTYGISSDRISVKWYGATVQPYKEVVKNRVVIIEQLGSETVSEVENTQPENVTLPPSTSLVQNIVELKSEVFFNVDKSDVLDATQEEEITKVAEYLNNNPQAKVIVSGYANKTSGTEEYNNALSKKRAVSVANALIQKHAINFHRVQVRWFGGGVQPHRMPTMNQVVILKVVQ